MQKHEDIKTIQRFYGVIEYANGQYSVKITVKGYPAHVNNAYSYEVLKIESPIVTNKPSGQSIQSEHS